MSYCPECEAAIDADIEAVGEIVSCPECGVELEVISVDPVEFDLAPMDEEDEEDDEFGFDDSEDEDKWDEEGDSYEEDDDDREDDS